MQFIEVKYSGEKQSETVFGKVIATSEYKVSDILEMIRSNDPETNVKSITITPQNA